MQLEVDDKRLETAEISAILGRIRADFRMNGVPFAANDAIGEHLTPAARVAIERSVASAFESVLDALLIDRDHNTERTAERVAKMYVREIFAGRYLPAPPVTEFPNTKTLDELYTVGPITVRSTCSHHFCPITGKAWIGVIPNGRLIGLSKFSRLTEWVMARPQIQEDAVVQLADVLEQKIEPRGLGVVIKASHSCMTMRGVKDTGTIMTTSVLRGILFHDERARSEFYKFVESS